MFYLLFSVILSYSLGLGQNLRILAEQLKMDLHLSPFIPWLLMVDYNSILITETNFKDTI